MSHTHRVRIWAETPLDTVSLLSIYHDGESGPTHSHGCAPTATDGMELAPYERHYHRVNMKTGATSEAIPIPDEWNDTHAGLD